MKISIPARIESDIELIPFMIDGYHFRVERLPRRHCKRCYGKGKVGVTVDLRRPVICKCVGTWKSVGPLPEHDR